MSLVIYIRSEYMFLETSGHFLRRHLWTKEFHGPPFRNPNL